MVQNRFLKTCVIRSHISRVVCAAADDGVPMCCRFPEYSPEKKYAYYVSTQEKKNLMRNFQGWQIVYRWLVTCLTRLLEMQRKRRLLPLTIRDCNMMIMLRSLFDNPLIFLVCFFMCLDLTLFLLGGCIVLKAALAKRSFRVFSVWNLWFPG